MLKLSRRPDESLIIHPAADLDSSMTVAELFKDGPLVVTVQSVRGNQVRLAIDAPMALSIVRDELL